MSARVALLLLVLSSWGCSTPREVPSEIPAPASADSLDPPVREQLEARRSAVAASPRDGDAWGALGLWFDAYEQWEPARDCYGAAFALTGRARWLELRAHAERLSGEAATARRSFSELLAMRPEAVAARVWSGELALADGRFEDAAELFAEALEREPGHVRARAGKARVLLESGEPRAAVALLEACLEEQPRSGTLHHLLGLALRELGDEPRAREHLELAAAQGAQLSPVAMADPSRAEVVALRADARAQGRRAGAALRESRFDEALSRLRAAVDADPEDATAALNLARAQARLGEPRAAVATLDELLRREPSNARALEVRALSRSLAGDEEGALADFRESLRLDPAQVGAQRQLARLLWSRGERAASLPHWQRVVELEPADAQARLRRAEALAHAERWSEAVAALERDVDELPRPAPFRQLLARTLSVAPAPVRDAGRALEVALADHERVPRLPQAETVAIAQASMGDFEAALAWQEAAAAAVGEAGREESEAWVLERLDRLRRGVTDRRPRAPGEGRSHLLVASPEAR